MPYSTKTWDSVIPPYVEKMFQEKWPLYILDVGAGAGKRAELLKDYYETIDAVEIREPYIKEFNLQEKYDSVELKNVMDMTEDEFNCYDLVILGDIFEHLSVEDATKILDTLKNKTVFIMIPFNCPQWECYGNVYETHLQDDLTLEVMKERYPQLKLQYSDVRFGFYTLNFLKWKI